MECNIVQDLLPLYLDACCSRESREAVEAHLQTCPDCKALCQSLQNNAIAPAPAAPEQLTRIRDWRASVLQSVLLFASFAVLVVGVALEAATPSGPQNGLWAVALIIPATGFLLSLANWYFIRLYPSRRRFSVCSCLADLGLTLAADLWAVLHYRVNFAALPGEALPFWIGGLALTAVLCLLARLLSARYAAMLGKQ